jgi:hypothetical protein
VPEYGWQCFNSSIKGASFTDDTNMRILWKKC